MKIGVMLRHFGQPGGIGVYTHNIVKSILQVDQKNQYVLMYKQPKYLGTFSQYPNVKEVVLRSRSKLLWDELAVPHFADQEGLDIIYNPKLSIPLTTHRKTVFFMPGGAQFTVPQAYLWYDRMYYTIANRLYSKKATVIITVAEQGAKDIVKYMWADPKKIHVIPLAYNELCRVLPPEERRKAKEKYGLPDDYLFFLGGISPLKNFSNILRAFHLIHAKFPHNLVVTGFKRWKYSKDLSLIDELNLREDIIFTDFVPDEDIPALYNMADVFVFPSIYEGFGMPILEAMASGCPVVTSKTGSTPEVAGNAALLVDPYRPDEIAGAIERILTDHTLRESLVQKGLVRAKQFSWERSARETVALFESI